MDRRTAPARAGIYQAALLIGPLVEPVRQGVVLHIEPILTRPAPWAGGRDDGAVLFTWPGRQVEVGPAGRAGHRCAGPEPDVDRTALRTGPRSGHGKSPGGNRRTPASSRRL